VDGRIDALDTPGKLKEKYQATTMNEVFIKVARPDFIMSQLDHESMNK